MCFLLNINFIQLSRYVWHNFYIILNRLAFCLKFDSNNFQWIKIVNWGERNKMLRFTCNLMEGILRMSGYIRDWSFPFGFLHFTCYERMGFILYFKLWTIDFNDYCWMDGRQIDNFLNGRHKPWKFFLWFYISLLSLNGIKVRRGFKQIVIRF